MKKSKVRSQKPVRKTQVSGLRSQPSRELDNLNRAIWITRESIHAHQEAIRNLETKLTNQLSEFHRQVTAQQG